MSRIEDNYSPSVVSDARQLPDSDFYDHPSIAPLVAEREQAEAAHVQAMSNYQRHQLDLETVQLRLLEFSRQEAEIRSGFPGLAAADLAAGDLEFTAGADGRMRALVLSFKVEAAREALTILEAKSADMQRPIQHAAKRSEDRNIEIREKVWPLKLAAAYRARG